MAFPVTKKVPISPRKAIGVALPFNAPGVFVPTFSTATQLKSNLLNYFMTDPGERYMNVTFGLGLRRRLFEQLSTVTYSEVRALIQKDLQTYFPAVNVLELIVAGEEDYNTLNITLKYSVPNFGIQDEIVTTITPQ